MQVLDISTDFCAVAMRNPRRVTDSSATDSFWQLGGACGSRLGTKLEKAPKTTHIARYRR